MEIEGLVAILGTRCIKIDGLVAILGTRCIKKGSSLYKGRQVNGSGSYQTLQGFLRAT